MAWWLVFVAALAAILLLARLGRAPAWLLGALVALVAALDLLHFAHGYQPMGPPAKAIPPSTPAIAYLQRHAGDTRIAGLGSTLTNDWSTVYGLRDVRGYDAPQPSRPFYDLWRTMAPEQATWLPFQVGALSPQALRVLGLLGARQLIVPRGTDVGTPLLRPVYRGRDATVLVNRRAVPRAFVARQVRVVDGEEAELGTLADPRFDPRRDVVVGAQELGPAGGPRRDATRLAEQLGAAARSKAGAGTVRVVTERNAGVTLRARLPRRSFVVLDDAWAPGWSVAIDGRPARALRADMVLRGVVAPAGAHEIAWRYRVPGLRLGAALSALGALAWLGWAAALLARRRRAVADRARASAAR